MYLIKKDISKFKNIINKKWKNFCCFNKNNNNYIKKFNTKFKIFKYFFLLLIFISYIVKIDRDFSLDLKKYSIYTEYYNFKNNIKIGIYTNSLSNGGVERNTALLINYLIKIRLFKIYLFTNIKSNNEYFIPNNVERKFVYSNLRILKNNLLMNKIDIFIYQFYDYSTIMMLKSLKNLKVIFYNHSCFFFWIYSHDNNILKSVYYEYKNSIYVISLVPFENDYLFRKWGINSIYMNNFITFDYNKVIQSNLKSKKILMIGRASDIYKRFYLGIESMKYIIEKLSKSEMIIVSNKIDIGNLTNLIQKLNLNENVKFVGYTSNPEIFFKEASLHIFPSIAEAFPMVLSETKIYGIPSVLLGIDYVSTSKEGNINIYDENPKIIAKFAIKILNNYSYRKNLGKEARKSMKKYDNNILFKKWVKLLLSIYSGEKQYQKLCNEDLKISENESINIIENQIKLLRKRLKNFKSININDILNFSFIKNIQFF